MKIKLRPYITGISVTISEEDKSISYSSFQRRTAKKIEIRYFDIFYSCLRYLSIIACYYSIFCWSDFDIFPWVLRRIMADSRRGNIARCFTTPIMTVRLPAWPASDWRSCVFCYLFLCHRYHCVRRNRSSGATDRFFWVNRAPTEKSAWAFSKELLFWKLQLLGPSGPRFNIALKKTSVDWLLKSIEKVVDSEINEHWIKKNSYLLRRIY